jgi:hypothetical protein
MAVHVPLGNTVEPSRYERLMRGLSRNGRDIAAAFSAASAVARSSVPVSSARERAIRDVAAGVAAPALVGFVLWIADQTRKRALDRVSFLSRDGQVLYELACRLAPKVGLAVDLEYVYSSRLTWSLAGSDAGQLSASDWLFTSFMRSNAADVCVRLGLDPKDYERGMVESGVSLDRDSRANSPRQLAALRRFVDRPEVARAVQPRVALMRDLVKAYAVQHRLCSGSTGIVDTGWTGRMVGSFCRVLDDAGLPVPQVLFWGHEPRANGWTDAGRVGVFMYNSGREEGMQWRIPNAPFLVESFCMAEHGIVAGYTAQPDGRIEPVLLSERNLAAETWGISLHRATLYAFCEALDTAMFKDDDLRALVHSVTSAFWLNPARTEASAWGSYPYDSDPAGAAIRSLAKPFQLRDAARSLGRRRLDRGERAWLWGSVAMSGLAGRLLRPLLPAPDDRSDVPILDSSNPYRIQPDSSTEPLVVEEQSTGDAQEGRTSVW